MEQTGPQSPEPGQSIGEPGAPPPWPGYGAPPAPPAKSPNRLIALVLCIGLLGVACAGSVSFGVVRAWRDTKPAAEGRPAVAVGSPAVDGSGGPASAAPARPVGATGKVPAGSKASSYTVRREEDLARLCDRWYYPKSPRYTTAVAPHPIAISVRDRKDLDIRTPKTYLGIPYDAPAAIKAAWEPESPGAVQLVACVDLVTAGAKVKSCPIDKPEPSSIVMKEGTYRLSLYEVATRRKLFETRLTGEKETCPLFIVIGTDRAVYSGLEDNQLIDALRRYVEQ